MNHEGSIIIMNFINIFFIFQHWPMSTNDAYHCAYIHITVSPIWQSAILMLLERKEPSWNTAASWSIPGIGWAVETMIFQANMNESRDKMLFFFAVLFKRIFRYFWCASSKNWCLLFWFNEEFWDFFRGEWLMKSYSLLCLDLNFE